MVKESNKMRLWVVLLNEESESIKINVCLSSCFPFQDQNKIKRDAIYRVFFMRSC